MSDVELIIAASKVLDLVTMCHVIIKISCPIVLFGSATYLAFWLCESKREYIMELILSFFAIILVLTAIFTSVAPSKESAAALLQSVSKEVSYSR